MAEAELFDWANRKIPLSQNYCSMTQTMLGPLITLFEVWVFVKVDGFMMQLLGLVPN